MKGMKGVATITIVIVIILAVIVTAGVWYATSAPSKIKLIWWGGTEMGGMPTAREWQENISAKYGELHPNIEIETWSADETTLKAAIDSSLAAGTPPDILPTYGGGKLKAWVDEELILDITGIANESWAKQQFSAGALGISTFYGKNWALPVNAWGGFIWINTKVWESCDVEIPTGDWTWEEYINKAKALKECGAIPIRIGAKDEWPIHFMFMYLVDRIGGDDYFYRTINRAPGYSFNDSVFVEATEKLQEIVKEGLLQDGYMAYGWEESNLLFTEKDVAMTWPDGTWTIGIVESILEESGREDFELDLLPFPIIEEGEGDPKNILGAPNMHFCIPTASKNIEEAKDFLRFIMSETNQIDYVLKTGDLSAQILDLPEEAYGSLMKKAQKGIAEAPHIQMAYDEYCPPRWADTMTAGMIDLISLNITPEELCARLEDEAKTCEELGILPVEEITS